MSNEQPQPVRIEADANEEITVTLTRAEWVALMAPGRWSFITGRAVYRRAVQKFMEAFL